MKINKKFFEKNGYIVIKSNLVKIMKKKIEKETIDILKSILKLKSLKFNKRDNNYLDLMKYALKNDKRHSIFSSLYDLLPSSTLINSLGSDKFLLKITKLLGVSKPIIGSLPQVRIDRPKDKIRKTLLHQDYWYSFLSHNAITFWFPIGFINEKLGPLVIYPATHLKGIFKFKDEKGGTLSAVIKNEKLIKKKIILKEDEIVVFHQKLLHESSDNLYNIPRLSVQVRYNDLSKLIKPKASFRSVLSEFVKSEQNKFLVK
jgi:hypothetical protein